MWSAIVLLLACLVSRRRVAVVLGIGVACSVLAGHALSGLQPLETGAWSGTAMVVSDPIDRGGTTVADVSTGAGRLELVARGAAGRVVLGLGSGSRVRVEGSISDLRRSGSTMSRHVRSRLTARSVSTDGRVWWAVPIDGLRSAVLSGGNALPSQQRPVYGGFVLGDDRGRSAEVTEWFDAAGLSHLLVVSGENLVFVLLVAAPALDRLGARGRFLATTTIVLVFAAMTRFEPSILRATAMATVAALSVATGRRAGGRVALGLAVTVLLLLDPLLVHSLGFRLSVAACAGIVLLAPGIERRLRGPRRFRTVLAVTLAAQLAVAPLIVPNFGPMPVVAVPANLLAEPIAGLVMMWGCTVGVVAGLVGGPLAIVLQSPVRLGLWWIIGVARASDALPHVGVGLPALGALVATAVLVRRMGRHRGRRPRSAALPVP